MARLPVGAQGFTGTRNPSQAGPGHLTYTDGAELNAGVIQKEGGATKFNTIPLGIDEEVKSMLYLDGANNAVVFPDSAPSLATARIWTPQGDAKITTTNPKFGTGSLLLDGVGDWIKTPPSPDMYLGNFDFTIDFWFLCDVAAGTVARMFGQADATATLPSRGVFITKQANDTIQATIGNGTAILGPTSTRTFTSATNTGWHHYALVRSGDNLYQFIDGTQDVGSPQPLTPAGFTVVANNINNYALGQVGDMTTLSWKGQFDAFRYTVGKARWTANFTPPVGPPVLIGSGPGYTPKCVLAGINWSPVASITKDYVFLEGGFVLADSGAGTFNQVLVQGLRSVEEPPPYFCPGGGEVVGNTRKLFMFSANNQVQYTDADSGVMQAITAAPSDWTNSFPITGCYHSFRMWGAGNANDPHRLYYSKPDDHRDFTGGTVAVFPGEGETIIGMYSFRGALIIWKYPTGIYTLDTQDAVPANWKLIKLTDAVGSVSPHAIAQIENDVVFLDRHLDVHLLSTINELGDVNTSNISRAADLSPFIKDNIALSRSRRCNALWYPFKKQVWFGMSTLGADYNDIRLVLSFEGVNVGQQQGLPARFFMSRRDAMAAVWLRPDPVTFIPKPVAAAPTGFIYLLDTDTRDKVGTPYQIRFVTSQVDFAYIDPAIATRQKNGQFLELTSEPRGDWDLIVDTYWDGKYTDTIFFDMGGLGGVLGAFTLGVDQLGAQSITSRRRRLVGSGRRLRLACRNDGLGQDVVLSEFWAQFTVGDERDTAA